jgi:hypothetical protein
VTAVTFHHVPKPQIAKHALSFLRDHDPPSAVLPEHGSHAQKRELIEKHHAAGYRQAYTRSYTEHGRDMKRRGLLK